MKDVIEKVLKDFNFERVHKAMVAMNWTWFDTNGVPSISELVLRAQELLEEVAKKKVGYTISTVGFIVEKMHNDKYGNGLSLMFKMAECERYENDEWNKYC